MTERCCGTMSGCANEQGERETGVRAAAFGVLVALLLVPSSSGRAQAPAARAWTEERVVEQLNKTAERFHTVTASLEFTKVTVVVNDRSTETGRLHFTKKGKILIEFLNPEPKEVLFTGNKAQIYFPKMSQIQEYDLGKHRALVEQYLLLGFGTKGDELRDSYLLTILKESKLDGRAVLQLELTPKDERLRSQLHKIHLWLDLASWLPVQQKFFEVGGDYFETRYADMKVNVTIPASKQRLSAPRGTKVVKPRASL